MKQHTMCSRSDKVSSKIRSCSFDTTATNTGHMTAAIVTLQQKLNKHLLLLACRHHMFEVVLDHVWKGLEIEPPKSPQYEIFKPFRSAFNDMGPLSSDDCVFYEPTHTYHKRLHAEVAADLLKLSKEYHPREDYLECLTLALLFLNGKPISLVRLLKCGAISTARWMAKIIFGIKIVLIWPKIKHLGIISEYQFEKLLKFVKFVVYIYLRYWFAATLTSQAPRNDLAFFKSAVHYKTVDEVISKSAVHALRLHTWYLTEDLVGLSLFDNKVSVSDRTRMAALMKSYSAEYEEPLNRVGSGKPFLPFMTYYAELPDLVGPSSPILFRNLEIQADFLDKPVNQWEDEPSYIAAKKTVYELHVVNDLAERGVRLTSECLRSAKLEHRLQNNLQVVEVMRKNQPKLRCKKNDIAVPFDVLAINKHLSK